MNDRHPHIDGLRAIAVMAVLFGHAYPSLLPGGYLGVDIFFVISGYLITGIITSDMARGRFTFREFYLKRVYRLLPAFLTVVIISIIVAALLQSSREFITAGLTSIASLFSVSNFYLATAYGYFSPEAGLNPFLHTWSLGVEEQFYIVFPIIVLLCLNYRTTRFLAVVLLIGSTASLAHTIHLHSINSSWAHFSPLARIWQLGAGALIALHHLKSTPFPAHPWHELTGGAALLIIMVIAAIGPSSSVAMISVTLSTGVIIHFGRTPQSSLRVLTLTPVILLGLMSYSLYLWHQPVMSFARLLVNDNSAAFSVVTIALSLLLAYPTWKYIEAPMRNHRIAVVPALIGLFGLFFIIIVAVISIATIKSQSETGFLRQVEISYDLERAVRSCGVDHQYLEHYDPCRFTAAAGVPYQGKLAIWGDSHASALASGFAGGAQGYDVISYGIAGCLTSFEPHSRSQPVNCEDKQEAAVEAIIAEGVDLVIIHSLWSDSSDTQKDISAVTATLVNAIDGFRNAEIEVILVGATPVFRQNVRTRLLLKKRGIPTAAVAIDRADHENTNRRLHSFLNQVSKTHDSIKFLDPIDIFCDQIICTPRKDEMPLFFDMDHLNVRGAEIMAKSITEERQKLERTEKDRFLAIP